MPGGHSMFNLNKTVSKFLHLKNGVFCFGQLMEMRWLITLAKSKHLFVYFSRKMKANDSLNSVAE